MCQRRCSCVHMVRCWCVHVYTWYAAGVFMCTHGTLLVCSCVHMVRCWCVMCTHGTLLVCHVQRCYAWGGVQGGVCQRSFLYVNMVRCWCVMCKRITQSQCHVRLSTDPQHDARSQAPPNSIHGKSCQMETL